MQCALHAIEPPHCCRLMSWHWHSPMTNWGQACNLLIFDRFFWGLRGYTENCHINSRVQCNTVCWAAARNTAYCWGLMSWHWYSPMTIWGQACHLSHLSMTAYPVSFKLPPKSQYKTVCWAVTTTLLASDVMALAFPND